MKSNWLRVGAVIEATVPECTCSAANRFVVPFRRYSLSRRAGRPGLPKHVGAGGLAGRDRGLLVDRDDDRVVRRIEVQATNLGRLGVEVGTQLAHDPVLGQVRTHVGAAQNLVGLGLRHPDRLGQLAMRPALPAHALHGVWRTRARGLRSIGTKSHAKDRSLVAAG